MDSLPDDLLRAAKRAERAARTFKEGRFSELRVRIQEQIKLADRAWSHSWIGYHARVYIDGLKPAEPGERWDSEWGAQPSVSNATRGRWVICDDESVKAELLRRAAVSADDEKFLRDTASQGREVFDEVQSELLPTLDAVCAKLSDPTLRRVRDEIQKVPSFTTER